MWLNHWRGGGCHTPGSHAVTSTAEKKKNPPVRLHWMAKKEKKMHLKRSFLFLWGSDSCSSAHHHDGKVIDRPPTLQESNFTGNLQWLLGQSYTLIPEGKHHYGLSFISAVLGQFKPTQRTPFLGKGAGGGVTQAMTDGKDVATAHNYVFCFFSFFFFFFFCKDTSNCCWDDI